MRRAGRLLSAQMPLSCGGRERLGGAACVAGGSGRVRGRRVKRVSTYLAACRPAGKAAAQLASVLQNASSRSRPFFAFARLEGGQPLTVAQLALETLLTALLTTADQDRPCIAAVQNLTLSRSICSGHNG